MQIGRISGCTRVIGKSQGYMGLPLRDEMINCTVNGQGTPSMVTAWHPTPKELEALNAGAPVHVRILGSAHPPIMVEAGPRPEASLSEALSTDDQLGRLCAAIRAHTAGNAFWLGEILLAEIERETGFKP